MSGIQYAWYSGQKEIEALAAGKNYEILQGVPVLSVKLTDLFGSAAVRKALRARFPAMEVYSFADLWDMEYVDIVHMLERAMFGLTEDDLLGYEQDLAHVAYDERGMVRAVILARTCEDGYYVDLLMGSTKQSQFIMAVTQQLLCAVEKRGDMKDKRLSMLDYNNLAGPLLQRALDKGCVVDSPGNVHYVRLSKEDAALSAAIREAEGKDVYQGNISLKYART